MLRETATGRLAVFGSLWLATAAIGLALLRAGIVADGFADYGVPARDWFGSVLLHDAGPVSVVLAACALALASGRGWLRLPLALVAIVVVALMLADVAVRFQLYQRLYVTDLVKFRKELDALRSLLAVHARSPGGLAILVAGGFALLATLWALLPHRRRYGRWAALLGIVAAVAAAAFLLRGTLAMRSTFADHTANLFEVNADLTVDRPYSPEFVARLHAAAKARPTCTDGLSRHLDIVVVVVESLSMYQSRLMSGGADLLPALDRLAGEATWFDGFIANGFTTDHGLIALLTGRDPTPAFGRYASLDAYHGFADVPDALPRRLAARGYRTAFLASSDLSFLGKGDWLRSLGFDQIEGHDHPFYEGSPRSHFGSAPDGVLYARALQWISEQSREQAFALVVATTSSHPPFTHPISGARSEEATFRYVDEVTAGFARQLRDAGYFQNGVLIVTSDHRAMTPVRAVEAGTFGESALARIPLIAVGPHRLPAGRRSGSFQQADLPASLEHLVASGPVCRAPHTGLLFAEPGLPAAEIVHARGDRRSQLDVFVGGHRHALRLAGDSSHWIGPAPARADAIAARIHRDRAERGSLHDSDQLLDYYIRHLVPQDDSRPP